MPSQMSDKTEFFMGARESVPLALSVTVYGMAFGLLAPQAGFDHGDVGVMSALVYGGSAQIVAVERLISGSVAMAAVIAGVALNLRLMLMTATLQDELRGRPWWQIALGVQSTTDANWALTKGARASGRAVGYWYHLGGGGAVYVAWMVSTLGGSVLAQLVPAPERLGLDFALTAASIGLLRGLWKGTGDMAPWLVSGAVVVIGMSVLGVDPSLAMIAGGIGGAALAGVRGMQQEPQNG